MSEFHVCPLTQLQQTITASNASHIATLVSGDHEVIYPDHIRAENRLFLTFNDIAMPRDGLIPPSQQHILDFLEFVHAWDQDQPMVIHCWAGISRSTAGAYIAQIALNPASNVVELTDELRRIAPSATPNPMMIAIADDILGKDGAMIKAIKNIGRGEDAFEGTPFVLPAKL